MYVTGHYETAEVAEDVISFIVTNPRLTKSLVSLIKFHSEETTIIDLLAEETPAYSAELVMGP